MSRGTRVSVVAVLAFAVAPAVDRWEAGEVETSVVIRLPAPAAPAAASIENALQHRRSVREWSDAPVTLAELSRLLWAAQGVTSGDGRRTAPSAGALYPIEVLVVAGRTDGLDAGVYRYRPGVHELAPVRGGDYRSTLAEAALEQTWMRPAPVILVIAAVEERTARKYGTRAPRYVAFEAGAVAENVALQAVSLGLGSVVVGAFDDAAVGRAVGLASGERPLAILPIGRPR